MSVPSSMVIMRIEVVLPTRWDWLVVLLMIGIFGLIAQLLLTLGLQRETAGRGTMAVYVQVRRHPGSSTSKTHIS